MQGARHGGTAGNAPIPPDQAAANVRRRTRVCPKADIDGKTRSASTDPALLLGVMGLESTDWQAAGAELDAQGWAVLPGLLDRESCRSAASLWRDEARFRSRVVMARHGFGQGEYRYFAYPLPAPIASLRAALYPPLAEVANHWQSALGRAERYPEAHSAYLDRCRASGQKRPTPLLLRYGPGDYNCLHQDLYGAEAFPLQAAILLSRPGEDFTGGEFLLAEQRPRRQSRATVVPLEQGDAVVFAVSERPVKGGRGWYRTRMKHGVSKIRSGERFTAGLIFHDAA
jgi:hypothetical protein